MMDLHWVPYTVKYCLEVTWTCVCACVYVYRKKDCYTVQWEKKMDHKHNIVYSFYNCNMRCVFILWCIIAVILTSHTTWLLMVLLWFNHSDILSSYCRTVSNRNQIWSELKASLSLKIYLLFTFYQKKICVFVCVSMHMCLRVFVRVYVSVCM